MQADASGQRGTAARQFQHHRAAEAITERGDPLRIERNLARLRLQRSHGRGRTLADRDAAIGKHLARLRPGFGLVLRADILAVDIGHQHDIVIAGNARPRRDASACMAQQKVPVG